MKSRSDPAGEQRRRLVLGAAGSAIAALASGWHGSVRAESSRLARIRERGHLLVGLYKEMPPFHAEGQGIDAELGRALARELGVGFSPLPFQAGENMNDDLRNMVWKGHYLGWGPADVLLHVPVDRPLMQANPQVQIVAPYFRERVMLALDASKLPRVESLGDLQGQAVAVAGQSMAGWLLAGAEGGALKERLITDFADGVAAAQALRGGRVAAAAGLASELESVLGGDSRYTLQPLPSPRLPREGWAVGCAVRKDADDLAMALQQAMQNLQASGRLQALFAQGQVGWHL
ncbi:MAG TPA: transporter substrate-binding domain-containing protein [Ideonella sp.]|nr:transporter substrate-binding domain-containing protein [Ideonella sp.]